MISAVLQAPQDSEEGSMSSIPPDAYIVCLSSLLDAAYLHNEARAKVIGPDHVHLQLVMVPICQALQLADEAFRRTLANNLFHLQQDSSLSVLTECS